MQAVTPPRLEGVFPIAATPFRPDGSADLRDLARLVDFIDDARSSGPAG